MESPVQAVADTETVLVGLAQVIGPLEVAESTGTQVSTFAMHDAVPVHPFV